MRTRLPDLERYNESFVGGVIAGGQADITQLFTRPVTAADPTARRTRAFPVLRALPRPAAACTAYAVFFAAQERRLAATASR